MCARAHFLQQPVGRKNDANRTNYLSQEKWEISTKEGNGRIYDVVAKWIPALKKR